MKRWFRLSLSLCFLFSLVMTLAQPITSTTTYVSQMQGDTSVISLTLGQRPETKLLRDTIDYQWISYKAKVDLSGEQLNNSCQLFFVNRVDSIIYLNFHVSGVEIMRVVVTPDEVTLVNKLDHTYYQGDYSIFSRLFGMQADFYFIQSLFNKCDLVGFEDNLTFVDDDRSAWRMVSPLRRHLAADWSVMHQVELNPSSGELQNEITDLTSGKVLAATYRCDTTCVGSPYCQMILHLPFKGIEVALTPRNVKYNVPGPTSIKIPDKFARLIY